MGGSKVIQRLSSGRVWGVGDVSAPNPLLLKGQLSVCIHTLITLRKRETNMSIICFSSIGSILKVCMVYMKTLNDPFQSPFSYANGANIKRAANTKNANGGNTQWH